MGMVAEAKIKEMVATIAKIPLKNVTSTANLRKLGIDSLVALELVAKLERTFRIHIPEEKIREVGRVDHIVHLVSELKHEAIEVKASSARARGQR